jgi:hypothetical protein
VTRCDGRDELAAQVVVAVVVVVGTGAAALLRLWWRAQGKKNECGIALLRGDG